MANSSAPRTGVLVILDGFGIRDGGTANAVALAKTPILDALFSRYPSSRLQASESFVGLPRGFMGNSEVGHLNIGAGRVVYQDFSLISRAVENGSFLENPALVGLLAELGRRKGRRLHLMGLVSDGGVHSHISHLFALLKLAKQRGVERVDVHVFTDGRDTSPTSGVEFLSALVGFCRDLELGTIVTVSGRFYAMDRDSRWERTQRAYEAVVSGTGEGPFRDPVAYLRESYDRGVTDEFIVPGVARGYRGIGDGDAIVFFNFRADRARQLTRAIHFTEFPHFRRESFPALCGFVSMTRYDESFRIPSAFERSRVPNTLGEIVSRNGWKQLRIAETEKYAHVTYFFNGGDERVFEGEKRVLVPSPRDVRTYDLKPEMSASEVSEMLTKELRTGEYRFAVVNFANCDMVGHTGNVPAAVKAVETVDRCLAPLIDWIESQKGFAIVTADHGNCERMLDDSGRPFTAHTLSPVPFLVVDPMSRVASVEDGSLCDVAPTMLALWGEPQPQEMTGRSLVVLRG